VTAPPEQAADRRRDAVAVLVCVAVALVPLGTGPWTGRIPYLSDIANVFHPQRAYTSGCLARGEIPWWNPHSACGIPHATDPQSSFFYPLNWLLDRIDPAVAIGVELPVHLALASVLTYALARVLRIGRIASVFAATAFVLSGIVFQQIQCPPALRSIAWTPGILLGAAQFRFGRQRAGMLLSSLSWALSALGGHAQFTVTALAPALAVAWEPGRVGLKARMRTYVPFGVAVAVGSLVAAVGILPGLAYAPLTQRVLGFSDEALATTSLGATNVLSLLFARAEVEPGATMGLVAPVLAVAAFMWQPRASIPLAIVAAGGLVAALGPATPFGTLIHSLPPFRVFHYAVRHLEAVQFACVLLAAKGLDGWCTGQLPQRRLGVAAACGSLVYLAAVVTASGAVGVRDAGRVGATLAGVVALLVGWRLAPAPRAAVVVACCAAELALMQGRAYWREEKLVRPSDLRSPPADLAALPPDARDGAHRVVVGRRESMSRLRTLAWSIDNPGAHLPLVPLRLLDFASVANSGALHPRGPLTNPAYSYGVDRLDSRLLDLVAVRYAVRAGDALPPGWTRLAPGVWQRECRLEQVRIVPSAEPAATLEDAARRLADPAFDPSRSVVVEGDAGPPCRASGPLPRVRSLVRRGDGFTVELEPGAEAWLAASYNALPGFRCEIDGPDGTEVPIRTADVAFLAVRLPEGARRAVFTYTPPGLRAGAAVSVAGLLLLGVLVAGHPTRRSASGAVPPGPARG
jgi:hypothetical protein